MTDPRTVQRTEETRLVPHEHISNATELTTVAISNANAAEFTVYTPNAGHIFVVWAYQFSQIAAVNQIIEIESGTTKIAELVLPSAAANFVASMQFREMGGMPLLIGRSAGEALNVDPSGATLISGYMVVGEMPPRGAE